MILRGQTTAAFFKMQRRIAQRSMSRYRPFIYFVRKVRYLSKFNYELLIFETLKMISIHATTLCLRSGLCGIIIIARKFEHPFVYLCPIKIKETVNVITRIYFVLL